MRNLKHCITLNNKLKLLRNAVFCMKVNHYDLLSRKMKVRKVISGTQPYCNHIISGMITVTLFYGQAI